MEEELSLAKSIALEAGAIMLSHFGQGTPHTLKPDHSPVTDADTEVHALVVKRISAAFPAHSLLGEEGVQPSASECVWVFDPVDGTVPFLRGVPTNVFALALVCGGVPVAGVVYDPYMKRLYHAVKGEGAFMNDEPIHTAATTELAHSYIETDGHRGFKDLLVLERARSAGVRFLSYSSTTYAHMLVASGQIEGVVFPPTNPWDAAAAKVIVEEAGGVTSDVRGKDQRYDGATGGFVSSCTPEYHAKLLALIAPSLPDAR